MRLYGGVYLVDYPCLKNVERLDLGCLPMIDRMHANGILIDQPYFSDLDSKLAARLGEIRLDADALVGGGVNIGSADQVAELLFGRMGLVPPGRPRKLKSGRYSTEDEVLASMIAMHPVVQVVMDYREIDKLRNTYTIPMPGMVSADGRLRTIFKATRTSTGRLSSGDRAKGYPNLQNIPVKGEWGKLVRDGFVAGINPRTGRRNKLVSLDLSQIEMRVACHLAQEPRMALVFVLGQDIHWQGAIALFRLVPEEILGLLAGEKAQTLAQPEEARLKYLKHRYRLPAKNLNFGVLYGQTAKGLQARILAEGGPLFTEEECQTHIDRWYETYDAIKDWIQLQYERARRHGMVWDMFGRIRLIPQAKSVLADKRAEGDRECGNMPIQGSAQGLLKLAMAELTPVVEYFASFNRSICLPLIQVHDELIFEVSDDIADEFARLGNRIMCNTDRGQMLVPVESSSDIAETWGMLK